MHNFVYENPTKILFGRERLEEFCRETAATGENVLLVTGRESLKKSGLYDRLLQTLQKAGCHVTTLEGIRPNPTLEKVHEGIALFRENGCDIICAAGGGSVIDTAKAISCGVPVEHDVWKFFTGRKKLCRAVPLTTLPTLAASGSENNSGMVITNEELQLKLGYGNKIIAPRVSWLNPEHTFSASAAQTGFGSADIISHLIEFFCNNAYPDNTLHARMIAAAIRSVLDNCHKAQQEPDNYNARAELMWAAALALSGLFQAGLGRTGFPVHLIEHGISAVKNTPHGAGMAVLLPLWMQHQAQKEPHLIAKLGRVLFHLEKGSEKEQAEETAGILRAEFTAIQCPASLAAMGVSGADVLLGAQSCQPLARLWRLREYTPEVILDILQDSL